MERAYGVLQLINPIEKEKLFDDCDENLAVCLSQLLGSQVNLSLGMTSYSQLILVSRAQSKQGVIYPSPSH
jgi:hypothetical protein